MPTKNKILILGPQGSGKGTQAARLAEKLQIPALSMGQLLRDEVASGSALGEEIARLINEGELVSDEVALRVLKRRLQEPDAEQGYILDGYPRSQSQYETYEGFDSPTAVLFINVPREESVARISKRAEIEGRVDDTPEKINRRLQIYEEETAPIINLYRERGLLKEIDGMGSMEDVETRINEALV